MKKYRLENLTEGELSSIGAALMWCLSNQDKCGMKDPSEYLSAMSHYLNPIEYED